ncbi:MAG: calcium-binding protein [Lysobacteraceae bacterium]|nr:MAG: calcium-binding protein [Xanthomonadaceae bacterium]
MKPVVSISLGLCLAALIVPALAQNSPTDAGKAGKHRKIDTNSDGVIDRNEAAANPRLAERFEVMDRNKDGRLSADERPQRGNKQGRRRDGGGMAMLDANGDGAVDRTEAAKAPRLLEHFDRLDADKDGRISAAERPQHGKGQGQRQGRHGARKLDTDGDGRFSRAELSGKERVMQNFDAIDTDKNGYLTHEEMRTYRQAHRGQGRK